MTPSITVVVDGRSVQLAAPIGLLEDVARINPRFGEIARSFVDGNWEFPIVQQIIVSGLRYAKSETTFAQIYEAERMTRCAQIAMELFAAAFMDVEEEDEGEADAAERKLTSV